MVLIVALFGLALGSYLNVVIGRLRSGEKGFRRRSWCPECHRVLKPSELIPLVSFFVLGRRCKGCRKPISWQYPLVEFSVMALIIVSFYVRGGAGGALGTNWLYFVRDIVFVMALVTVFIIDLRDMLVFDSVTLTAAGIGFLMNWYLGTSFTNLLLAVAVGAGFFLFQYVVSGGRWVGGGDIRIGIMMGAMLGFPGVVAALLIAYIIGSLTALGLIAARKTSWKSQMPFGTFLAVATAIVLFFGGAIWMWYGSLLF